MATNEPATTTTSPRHWDSVYASRGADELSWYQATPTTSLDLIAALDLNPDDGVVDVGGGASVLVDALLDLGYRNVTVLDVSDEAMSTARARLGVRADEVSWIRSDVLRWNPPGTVQLWHDRAVFHFLTEDTDKQRYREICAAGVAQGGHVVVGTFAANGPTTCSGLSVARYDPDQLADAFGPAFSVVTAQREVHRTPKGIDQPFTWLVLRRGADRDSRIG